MRAEIKAGRVAAAVARVLLTIAAQPMARQRGGHPALVPAVDVLAGRN